MKNLRLDGYKTADIETEIEVTNNIMNFTTTPPTVAGFYAWRPNEAEWIHCEVLGPTGIGTIEAAAMGGEWCRLVPAEEIARAYHEGMLDYSTESDGFASVADSLWNNSRAKRVAEGTE